MKRKDFFSLGKNSEKPKLQLKKTTIAKLTDYQSKSIRGRGDSEFIDCTGGSTRVCKK
jgi:hypothetical protein